MNFRPRISYEDGMMAVRFDYNKQLVELVVNVDRRVHFDNAKKAFLFPVEQLIVKAVCDLLGFRRELLPPELANLLEKPPARPRADRNVIGYYQCLTAPLEHQWDGLAELLSEPYWLLAWEQGCGKTHPTVNRIRYGLLANQLRGPVLVFAPRNVAQSVWPKELLQHGGITAHLLLGSKKKRLEILNAGLAQGRASGVQPVFVTNYEATRVIWEQLRMIHPDLVVCDECQHIKRSTTTACRRICLIAEPARYRYALSGTPAPNSPLDIFGTLQFLNPAVAGTRSKVVFEARYSVKRSLKEGGNQVIVGYKEMDELAAKVARVSSRLKKADCLDLPPKTIVRLPVDLTSEQQRVYKELRSKAVAELRSLARQGTLTVANILTESLRLLQTVGGFVPDDLGHVHALEPNVKLDALEELLDESDGKVIIWANFVAEIRAIETALRKRNDGEVVLYSGETKDADRRESIEKFQFGDARYFLGTPAAGGTGLTLTASSTSIYFSRSYNLTHWLQSQDRNHRIGTRWPVTIYLIQARGTVDEKLDAALIAKENLQEILLGSNAEEQIDRFI